MNTVAERPPVPPGPEGVNPSRARPAVRELYARPVLSPADLSAPLLVLPDGHAGEGRLPGAVPLSAVPAAVGRWARLGIRGLKVFALGHDRDAHATGALAGDNLMLRGIAAVKRTDPGMAVTTEVCGCSWTDHGQCVLRTGEGGIDLGATLALMRGMAVQHAGAGADVVSPTAMLDGSVRAVRDALDAAGLRDVGVNPNLAIHSALYGPFKELMGTDPRTGHRRGLQLEPARADRDTLVQARRWIAEGADSLTLQPVLTAVDVLARLRADQDVPLVAYSTSGEVAALRALGTEGTVEYHAMLKRTGADQILTFAAEEVATHLERAHG
ncbi:porphobilinogen synthase [Streptomyces sp. UNOC14_S4]|uniref:porphobilinogen synthase n=1 Tax=Streptomyces sp. UNOC14_S4 TaxID=2872340 RepID=UPI001E648135|nr:porphobilinogen synthase [Streptomyces sp. UNOC14_S4]MCC3767782.1 porphobilinogen synthase [Streptomyces sp. UNOC14_S4]